MLVTTETAKGAPIYKITVWPISLNLKFFCCCYLFPVCVKKKRNPLNEK